MHGPLEPVYVGSRMLTSKHSWPEAVAEACQRRLWDVHDGDGGAREVSLQSANSKGSSRGN
jgi:hypothetical protein